VSLPPRVVLEVPKTATTKGLLPLVGGMQSWQNSNGFVVITCPFHADSEKDNPSWYENAKKGMRDDQFNREVRLDFTARGGQKVFPFLEKNPAKWRVKPWGEIPKNYTIVASLDFGSRNATAILWFAVNERGHFHCFSEFYKPSNPSEIARYLKNHPYFPRLTKIACDPNIYNKNQHALSEQSGVILSIADMLNDFGVWQIERGNNDRLAGLERVKYMMRHSETENLRPYLTISEECPNLWRELVEIVYKEETPEQLSNRNASEDTVKKRDHAFDSLKYGLLSWNVPSDLIQAPVANEFSIKAIEEDIDRRREEEEMERYLL
jgi:hypothetical protein